MVAIHSHGNQAIRGTAGLPVLYRTQWPKRGKVRTLLILQDIQKQIKILKAPTQREIPRVRAGQVKVSGVKVLAMAELKLSLMTPYSGLPCIRFMEKERERVL